MKFYFEVLESCSAVLLNLYVNTWKVKNVKNIVTSKYEIADEMGEIAKLNEAKDTLVI